MQLNRIQVQIFKKLSNDKSLQLEEYLATYSPQYLGRVVSDLSQMTEQEADKWIHQAYLESMEE